MSITKAKEIVLSFLTGLEGKKSMDDHKLITKLRNIVQSEDDENKSFRFKDVERVMEDIKTCSETETLGTLLGHKPSRKDGRANMKRFYDCGKNGHIARDRPECYRHMKKKTREYQKNEKIKEQGCTHYRRNSKKHFSFEPDLGHELYEDGDSTSEEAEDEIVNQG